ncbi:MAG: ABC transporter ATP-binding protein [Candidatus Kerfeldbacteria bacterium]|jgi:putative ABC transport system ATP-binding protein
MALIELNNLHREYKQGSRMIHAVDGVNLKVEKGDLLVIFGESGSGKSTLLQLIGGLERPTKGNVVIDGQDITKMSEAKLTKLRGQKVGFIFQHYNLIPTLTALENVEAAIIDRSKDDTKKATEMLEMVGLKDRVKHLPSLLSGGEQQRVAIARALINKPAIILADEPTGNLDSKTGEEITVLLKKLNDEHKMTFILITHSEYNRKFASRIMNIKDGKLK